MAEPSKGDKMRVDTGLVRDLAKLLDECNLTEIEVEDGDRKVKVVRSLAPVVAPAPHAAATATQSTDSAANVAAASEGTAEIEGNPVKSPMVGTAFLTPEPGGKPFVSVGDKVKAGDTLLIIEAMKVMNPITAPAAGSIKSIVVSDAQPVEFDQVLMVIG